MWTDPIVEEVRKAREAYAEEFGFDLDAIGRDLRARGERLRGEGWNVLPQPEVQKRPADQAA